MNRRHIPNFFRFLNLSGGLKNTYLDNILAPVLKLKLETLLLDQCWDQAPNEQVNVGWLFSMLTFLASEGSVKTMADAQDCFLPVGITSENKNKSLLKFRPLDRSIKLHADVEL
ncbi:unnamed protein product [Lactuca saligna]|uniref:Uncharacterized protein n=1 Tax=Lactuca saligna TaxID=75948 RepID=A0AA35ZRX6_LACSI|nr:unnamed protein product [Lactuca saligna]